MVLATACKVKSGLKPDTGSLTTSFEMSETVDQTTTTGDKVVTNSLTGGVNHLQTGTASGPTVNTTSAMNSTQKDISTKSTATDKATTTATTTTTTTTSAYTVPLTNPLESGQDGYGIFY